MKCFLIFLGLAAAFTLALSPSLNRRIWYRVLPETPCHWRPKYRQWHGGEPYEPDGDPEL